MIIGMNHKEGVMREGYEELLEFVIEQSKMYRGIDLKGNEDIEYVVASIVSLLNLSPEVQRKLKKIRRG